MKIIYLHQYFKTPEEGGAIRSYHLAKAMVDHGWEVEMITTHNHKNGLENIKGIKVHYLKIPYDNSFTAPQRIKAFRTFQKQAYLKIASLDTPDLIYASSTPLSVGSVALKANKKLGIPYVFEVRDLWPEAPIQMGMLKNRIAQFYFKHIEQNIYKGAEKIVALSPVVKQKIKSQVHKKILCAPNMSDTTFFIPTYLPNSKIRVFYNGAIGKANAPHKIITLIKNNLNQEVNFTIMAQGSELSLLKEALSSYEQVRFVPYGNKVALKNIYDNVDVTLTSFLDLPVLEGCSPNKFFDSLAAGKVTLVNINGWLKRLVEQNYCGFHVDENTDLSNLLRQHNISELQKNAHNLAAKFHKEDVCMSIMDFISQ